MHLSFEDHHVAANTIRNKRVRGQVYQHAHVHTYIERDFSLLFSPLEKAPFSVTAILASPRRQRPPKCLALHNVKADFFRKAGCCFFDAENQKSPFVPDARSLWHHATKTKQTYFLLPASSSELCTSSGYICILYLRLPMGNRLQPTRSGLHPPTTRHFSSQHHKPRTNMYEAYTRT